MGDTKTAVPFDVGTGAPEAVTGETTTALEEVKRVPFETVTTGTLVVLPPKVTGETSKEEIQVDPALVKVTVENIGPAVVAGAEVTIVPFETVTGETTEKLVVPEAVTGDTTTVLGT